MSKMTKREKKFCKLYLKTRDVTYTKLKLGYSVDISKKHIRTYIQSKPITTDFNIELDPILRRLYAIATFDHLLMYDKDGDIKPLKSLSDEQRMAIKTYRESKSNVSYVTYDQHTALYQIMRYKELQMKEDMLRKPDEDEEIEIKISIDPRSKNDG